MQSSALVSWEFTLTLQFGNWTDVKASLNKHCKKWVFQLEKGEGGFEHYQGLVKLKQKKRGGFWITAPIFPGPNGVEMAHWTAQSNNSRRTGSDWYQTKEETRIAGPWKDTDTTLYIPRQVSKIETLRPWQQCLIDKAAEEYKLNNSRAVNCVLDFEGCTGKSTLAMYMACHGIGRKVPYSNDYKDLMRLVMCCPVSQCYLFDMPRAMKKDKLAGTYSAIESIKDGYAYDDRYKFKERFFDSPSVWIFTNEIPELHMLSLDRWHFWCITEGELLALSSETVVRAKKKQGQAGALVDL